MMSAKCLAQSLAPSMQLNQNKSKRKELSNKVAGGEGRKRIKNNYIKYLNKGSLYFLAVMAKGKQDCYTILIV